MIDDHPDLPDTPETPPRGSSEPASDDDEATRVVDLPVSALFARAETEGAACEAAPAPLDDDDECEATVFDPQPPRMAAPQPEPEPTGDEDQTVVELAPRGRLARGSSVEALATQAAGARPRGPANRAARVRRAERIATALAVLSSAGASFALTLAVGLAATAILGIDAASVGLVAGTTGMGAMLGFAVISFMYPGRPWFGGIAVALSPLAVLLLELQVAAVLACSSSSGLVAICAYQLIGELERRPTWPALSWRRRP